MTAKLQLRAESQVLPNEAEFMEAPRLGLAAETPDGQVYNEATFRHFLGVERKRSERSGSPFLLLLVDLKPGSTAGTGFEPELPASVFGLMTPCLRETDFVGWYHDRKVAAAVLTQLGDTGPEAREQVGQRVLAAIRRGLGGRLSVRLQVRVHQMPSRQGLT